MISPREAALASLMTPDYLARVEKATELYRANAEAVHAAVAALPDRVRLADGRELVECRRLPVNVGYRCVDGMVVMASFDATPHGLLRHASISCAKRDPRYRDLKLVRDALFPADVDVMMVLPRASEHINMHEHCLHLFETPAAWEGGLNV
jgi:hypothetical protein